MPRARPNASSSAEARADARKSRPGDGGDESRESTVAVVVVETFAFARASAATVAASPPAMPMRRVGLRADAPAPHSYGIIGCDAECEDAGPKAPAEAPR